MGILDWVQARGRAGPCAFGRWADGGAWVTKGVYSAAALVEERVWHESQRVEWLASEHTLFEELAGESRLLQATFRLADLVEFKRWIKGFGVDAEVVRPESLRQELRDELRAALRHYDDSPAAG